MIFISIHSDRAGIGTLKTELGEQPGIGLHFDENVVALYGSPAGLMNLGQKILDLAKGIEIEPHGIEPVEIDRWHDDGGFDVGGEG